MTLFSSACRSRRYVTLVEAGFPTLRRLGVPYAGAALDVGFPTPAMSCPRRCGLPWLGVRLRSSSWRFVGRRRVARGVMGCSTLVFVSLQRRRVSYVGVGAPSVGVRLPLSSRDFVDWRLAACIVVGCSSQGSSRQRWAEGGQYADAMEEGRAKTGHDESRGPLP